MNILFPGDCSMDSDIGPLAWLSTLAALFCGIAARRLIQEIAMRAGI
jgi:hypothetical protein